MPSAFSFMLPGLGQLYQQRLHVAFIAFGIFTLSHFMPFGPFLAPAIAIGAALDAFLAEKKSATKPELAKEKTRIFAFAATGMMAFVAWMSLIAATWFPVGVLLETNQTSDKLAERVRRCVADLGRYPQSIQDCNDMALLTIKDPWERPYVFRRTEQGFEIRSRGRDGKEGNQDDYVFRYR